MTQNPNHPRDETAEQRVEAHNNLAKYIRRLITSHHQSTGREYASVWDAGGLDEQEPQQALLVAFMRNPENKLIMLERVFVQFGGEKALLATIEHDPTRDNGPSTTYSRDPNERIFRRKDIDYSAFGAPSIESNRVKDPRKWIGSVQRELAAMEEAILTTIETTELGIENAPISAQEANDMRNMLIECTPDPVTGRIRAGF